MKITLFGKELNLKDHECSLNGSTPAKRVPSINLYVNMTNECNAHCKFCCNEKNRGRKIPFNVEKFKAIISGVSCQIPINKISFTGGEPTLGCTSSDYGALFECVKAVKLFDPEIFTVINTNGIHLNYLDEMAPYFDSIALSRHFYHDKQNMEIFESSNVATEADILSFKNKDKLHISCNLQKGYIDSSKKIRLFLEHVASLGVSDVGFVSLMPANDYCKKHFIDFADIQFNFDGIYRTKDWNYESHCRCRNYIYIPSEGSVDFVKVYSRYYCDPKFNMSTLVYDGEFLGAGFDGEIIIQKGRNL